jgi:dienelactone hydrolase
MDYRLPLLLLTASLLPAQNQADLDILLRLLPPSNQRITGRINGKDKSWEDWQRRTGELPPDFSKLPKRPFLPDPLRQLDSGAPITTQAQWQQQSARIRDLYQQWFIGRMPPAPTNLQATVVKETRQGDLTVREVLLQFGPDRKARLHVQLLIPPGKGPFPVFLTNHQRTRPWTATAVRRGYIGVMYQALDPIYGFEDDSETFIEAYPEYDFSCLARWAWAAMRTVDYLVTEPAVDKSKIAITGHSRNGKQALIAAAFDPRISAIALSSGNTGEGNPWRYTTAAFSNESLDGITTNFPHWFHPRLRFFSGRETQLPVDQNLLMSLIAPRGLLLASAYSEGQGAPFGFEQAYHSIKTVYDWMHVPGKIGLSLRAGEHATTAEDIEKYVDFFDLIFQRATGKPPETIILGYDFDHWKQLSGERAAQPGKDPLRWLLGDEPAGVPFPNVTQTGRTAGTSDGWLADLYRRPLKITGARYAPLAFGDDLKGDLYLPESRLQQGQRVPVVIWLHPYSHATGYSQQGRPAIEALVQRGFAVLAFDQIGFGTRIHQQREFYRRYPHWSLLGKMVADTRAAVAAVRALGEIDSAKIYLAGFSLGARVALWTAAQEPNVAAVAMAGGYHPVKLSSPDDGSEGIRHFSHLHGLLPRMGFYLGRPSTLPADESDVLARLAPRPVLLISGTLDHYAPVDQVRRSTTSLQNVKLLTPEDFHRFTPTTLKTMADWLSEQAR